MKKMLLLLSLIAVPAWAGEAATPAAVEQSAPKLEAMKAETVAVTRVGIELKGTARSVAAVVAYLEGETAYKEAACSTRHAKKAGKTAIITCAKADSGLMELLLKNSPAKVSWTISGTTTLLYGGCTGGCVMTICPVGSGILRCCKLNQPC